MKNYLLQNKILPCFYVALFAFLVFFDTGKIMAQPGDRRPAEEIEKDLSEQLALVNRDIQKNAPSAEIYEKRGGIYASLYEIRNKDTDKISIAENGIADFTKAIELTEKLNLPPKSKSSAQARIFSKRASLYQIIWIFQSYKIPEKSVTERIDHLYNNANFDNASADFAKSAELDPEGNYYLVNRSNLYLYRAEQFSFSPELFKEARLQNKENDIWEDFDEAITYASQANYLNSVFNICLKKGDTAFKFEKYDIALKAYQSDLKYAGQNYELLCNEKEEDSYCAINKRSNMSLFSYKRATVYLKLGEAEKALSEINFYFDKALHHECMMPFVLRMQIYSKLGRTELALAEEKRLRETPAVSRGGCDSYDF